MLDVVNKCTFFYLGIWTIYPCKKLKIREKQHNDYYAVNPG